MQEEIATPQMLANTCTAGFERRMIDHSPITPAAPAFDRGLESSYSRAMTPSSGQSLEDLLAESQSSFVLPLFQDFNRFP